jgi:hypothetical protein
MAIRPDYISHKGSQDLQKYTWRGRSLVVKYDHNPTTDESRYSILGWDNDSQNPDPLPIKDRKKAMAFLRAEVTDRWNRNPLFYFPGEKRRNKLRRNKGKSRNF